MIGKALYEKLEKVNHSVISRLGYVNLILESPEIMKPLLSLFFTPDNALSTKAGWVIEYTVRTQPELIYPHITFFTKNISVLTTESKIRPMATICESLIKAHYNVNEKNAPIITKSDKQYILTFCFDILIGSTKVAPKASAMQTLYCIGKAQEYSWIHNDLKAILEQDFNSHSAAYKARARHILKKLNA